MKTAWLAGKMAALLSILLFVIVSVAQETSAPAATVPAAGAAQQKVFVFVQRTDRHAKYSSPEVFHNVLDDLMSYLKTKNVAIAVDEFGGRNHAEGATPLDTIFTIAQDAKSNSVLYVVVDRPATKWLKITVQSFDMSKKEMWKEEVSSGGGFSGAHGFKVCTEKLHTLLDNRVGKDGLPVLAEAKAPEAQKQDAQKQ